MDSEEMLALLSLVNSGAHAWLLWFVGQRLGHLGPQHQFHAGSFQLALPQCIQTGGTDRFCSDRVGSELSCPSIPIFARGVGFFLIFGAVVEIDELGGRHRSDGNMIHIEYKLEWSRLKFPVL